MSISFTAGSGEKNNLAAERPEVVRELKAAYDRWWEETQPYLVNEDAVGPKVNPFKELYWKQFGGGPDEKLLKPMEPKSDDAAENPKKENRRKKKAN